LFPYLSLCSGGAEEPRTFFEFSNTEFHSLTAYKVFSCPRYTPAVMFFIEGLSKLYTLIAVSFVCFTTYGMDAHDRYTGSVAENLLLMMLFAQISYELGQLASCDWSLEEYFGGVWNILDVSSCVLLVVWALLLPFPAYFMYAKCAVALSAIPLAVVQLQYLSLIKTLGLLVLMIQSMIVDVYVFVVVYMVSIYGFTVCFRALFYTVNDYSSTGITFVTLFMSTLGGFNMDAFEGAYKMLGVVVMVVFLTLTNVLLVNLLIAQMSNTYNRIIFKSREEWTFIKVGFQSCKTCFGNAHVSGAFCTSAGYLRAGQSAAGGAEPLLHAPAAAQHHHHPAVSAARVGAGALQRLYRRNGSRLHTRVRASVLFFCRRQ
jgi:hypothetical protein